MEDDELYTLQPITITGQAIDKNYPKGLTWEEYKERRLQDIRNGAAKRYEAQLAPVLPRRDGISIPEYLVYKDDISNAYKSVKEQIQEREQTGYYLTHPDQRYRDEEALQQYASPFFRYGESCINTTTAMYGDKYKQMNNNQFTGHHPGFTEVIERGDSIDPDSLRRGDLLRYSDGINGSFSHTNMMLRPSDENGHVEVRNADGAYWPENVYTDYEPYEGDLITQTDIGLMEDGMPPQNKSVYRFTGDDELIERLKKGYERYKTYDKGEQTYGKGGDLKKKYPNWQDMPLRERSAYIRTAVKNGLYTMPEIRQAYKEFAEGGNMSYEDWKARMIAYRPDLKNSWDSGEYDYRGFYEDNPTYAYSMLKKRTDAHFTDEYKTPLHPTFSKESYYSANNPNPHSFWK